MKDKISSEDYPKIWMDLYCGLLNQKESGYNPPSCANTAHVMLGLYIKNLSSVREKYDDEQQIIWTKFFISCATNGIYYYDSRLIDLTNEAMEVYLKHTPELKKLKLMVFA